MGTGLEPPSLNVAPLTPYSTLPQIGDNFRIGEDHRMSSNNEAAGLAAFVLITSLLDHLVRAREMSPEEHDAVLKDALLHLEALRRSEPNNEACDRAKLFLEARLNASPSSQS